jgi:signal transduction histidine kinase
VLRRRDFIRALGRAAQAVQRARTAEDVYRTIGEQVEKLGYHAIVYTFTDAQDHVTIAHASWEPALQKAAERLTGVSTYDLRVPIPPDGLFRQMLATGESTLCQQTGDHWAQSFPKLGRALLQRVAAMVGMDQTLYAPLIVGEQGLGVLAIGGSDLSEFDIPAVTAFAAQAAIALQNARLFEKLHTSQDRLRLFAQRLVTAQEEERRRLARALHDEAGQSLTVLRLRLELIAEQLPPEMEAIKNTVAAAAASTVDIMNGFRRLARDLRPPALDVLGLGPALQNLCQSFAGRGQPVIEFHGVESPALDDAVGAALYRFLQEALTNVVKHARAAEVRVELKSDVETVYLSVEDDGQGFDPAARRAAPGIGLVSMREQLEALGGRLEISSRPGRGTRLAVQIPLSLARPE